MKKLLFILPLALLFTMCKTSKTIADTGKANVIYSDDFKGATDAQTKAFLKKLNATEDEYAVLVLTKNFVGSEITVSTNGKQVYKAYPISDKATRIAERIRISNTADTEVYESYSKTTVTLKAEDVKKHKFIYIGRNNSATKPFTVLYSNKLKK